MQPSPTPNERAGARGKLQVSTAEAAAAAAEGRQVTPSAASLLPAGVLDALDNAASPPAARAATAPTPWAGFWSHAQPGAGAAGSTAAALTSVIAGGISGEAKPPQPLAPPPGLHSQRPEPAAAPAALPAMPPPLQLLPLTGGGSSSGLSASMVLPHLGAPTMNGFYPGGPAPVSGPQPFYVGPFPFMPALPSYGVSPMPPRQRGGYGGGPYGSHQLAGASTGGPSGYGTQPQRPQAPQPPLPSYGGTLGHGFTARASSAEDSSSGQPWKPGPARPFASPVHPLPPPHPHHHLYPGRGYHQTAGAHTGELGVNALYSAGGSPPAPATAAAPSAGLAIPSVNATIFRDAQLRRLRAFVVRRYAVLSGSAACRVINAFNVRVGMHLFAIPTNASDLVSRAGLPRGDSSLAEDDMDVSAPAHAEEGVDVLALPEAFWQPPQLLPVGGGGLPVSPRGEPTAQGSWGEVGLLLPQPALHPEAARSGAGAGQSQLVEEALGFWSPDLQQLLESLSEDGREQGGGLGRGFSLFSGPAMAGPSWLDAGETRTMASAAVGTMAAVLVARRRYKTRICHAWLRSGGVMCPRKPGTCDYAHGPEELIHTTNEAHDSRFRTKLCRMWLVSQGQACAHGQGCSFAHGVDDLRVRVPESATEAEELIAAARVAVLSGSAPGGGGGSAEGHPAFLSGGGGYLSAASSVSSSGGSAPTLMPSSGGGSGGGVRRFKPLLCRRWLAGAADAAAVTATKMVLAAEAAGTIAGALHVHFEPSRAGLRRCFDWCEHAHGLQELRLPSHAELARLIQGLWNEPVLPPTAAAPVLAAAEDSPAVPLRDCVLLMIASTLLVPSLPPSLLARIVNSTNMQGRAVVLHLPPVGVLPDFQGLPYPLGRALSAAAINPTLQVVLPYALGTVGEGGGGSGTSGAFSSMGAGLGGGSAGGGPGGQRVGLSKIMSAMGNDASDTTLLAGCIALGAVKLTAALPISSLAEPQRPPYATTLEGGGGAGGEQDEVRHSSAVSGAVSERGLVADEAAVAQATGRYGGLLRRQLELASQLRLLVQAAKAQHRLL